MTDFCEEDLSYVYQGERSAVSVRADAKAVFELGHNDVDGSCCGVAPDQRLRQVSYHEAELHHAKQNLAGLETTDRWLHGKNGILRKSKDPCYKKKKADLFI